MLGLFIPWGPDHQNQRFRRGQMFSSLWEELKSTLSPRLLFHVQNIDAFWKSREEVLADRSRYHSYSEDQNDSTSDISEALWHDNTDDIDDSSAYNDEEARVVSLVKWDISSTIETIFSAIDCKWGFWMRIDDLKRMVELSSTLKM